MTITEMIDHNLADEANQSYELARKALAGKRDYCLILGVSVLERRPDNGEVVLSQAPVIEVWDRNALTFRHVMHAHELGMHFLGKTMGHILDNYQYCWPVEADEFRRCVVTGFSIQPAIRDEHGDAGWDQFIEAASCQFKPALRHALAFPPKD